MLPGGLGLRGVSGLVVLHTTEEGFNGGLLELHVQAIRVTRQSLAEYTKQAWEITQRDFLATLSDTISRFLGGSKGP